MQKNWRILCDKIFSTAHIVDRMVLSRDKAIGKGSSKFPFLGTKGTCEGGWIAFSACLPSSYNILILLRVSTLLDVRVQYTRLFSTPKSSYHHSEWTICMFSNYKGFIRYFQGNGLRIENHFSIASTGRIAWFISQTSTIRVSLMRSNFKTMWWLMVLISMSALRVWITYRSNIMRNLNRPDHAD